MGYNIFDDLIEDKERFESDTAQSAALIDAANIIAEALREQGLRQKDLAEKLSVSEGYVSRLLSGDENLTVRTMARILHALGLQYVQNSRPYEAVTVTESEPKTLPFAGYTTGMSTAKANVEVKCDQQSTEWTKAS